MVLSSNPILRREAATFFRGGFGCLEDKEAAWKDLIKLISDQDGSVRWRAASALRSVFSQVPNKDQAWKDLHRLAQDKENCLRWRIAVALRSIFDQVPNKDQAWEDLHRLTQDEDSSVRSRASSVLGSVFSQVPNKDQAWEDLHRLTQDENSIVRWNAAGSLGSVFSQVPNKDQVWNDLHRLIRDEDRTVRWNSSGVLKLVFSQAPNKDQAWDSLHRLTQDEDRNMRFSAAGILGSVFSQVPDKNLAWEDLHRMAQDGVSGVRSTSYHSLGRISILKATEIDEEFRIRLEEAIEFFRKSLEEAKYSNPAAFCLPFYQSLHNLLYIEWPKNDEVQKYLSEARKVIETSESRVVLLEAVNNLSKALQEVRAYSIDDIVLRKRDLKSYTKYCFQAAECLREARSKAPLASKVVDYTLVEKSIPILDQKIKTLFRDVEATAGELCKSTKGTDLEAFGRDAYESTRGLNKVESWIAADRYLEEIVPILKGHCNRLPKEAQAYLKTLVDSQDSASLEQRFDTLKSVLLASLVQGENDDRLVKALKELLDLHLQNIEFAILNLNTSSGNARKDLYNLKNQIDGLQKEIESQGLAKKELAEALDEMDQAMIERLEKIREKMLRAVRETTQLNASKRDVETILKELDDQDKLKKRDVLGIIADLSSLAGMALSILF
jgi:HEAT repeat protein